MACTYAVESCHSEDKFEFLNSKCKEKMIASQSSPLTIDECDILTSKNNFRELHRSQHECVHTFKSVREYLEFFLTHMKSGKIKDEDINMDVIHNRQKKEGGLYFRYPVLTVIMEKNY